jgi:hypothetical protein
VKVSLRSVNGHYDVHDGCCSHQTSFFGTRMMIQEGRISISEVSVRKLSKINVSYPLLCKRKNKYCRGMRRKLEM